MLTLDAYGPDVVVIRHAQIGAAALRHALHARRGRQRRRRQAPAPDAEPARPLHDARGARPARGRARRDRRRRAALARRALEHLALRCACGAHVTLVGPPSLIPRGIEATGVAVSHDIADIAERRRRLRAAHAARAHAAGRGLRAEPARVHAALRRHAGAPAPGPARHAPGPDEPRRRDRATRSPTRPPRCRAPGARRASSCGWPCSTTCSPAARPARRARRARRWRDCVPRPLTAATRPATLLVRGARVLDPGDGHRRALDVLVRDGVIAALGDGLDAPAERRGGRGRRAARCCPAFIDPHVHLRTPGQEHKEDLATGTAAAAAGGYCSDPRDAEHRSRWSTPPQVLRVAARARGASRRVVARRLPGGDLASASTASSSRRARRARRRAAPCGFSDDGRPVALGRRCCGARCSTPRSTGRVLSLHCEDRRSRARRDMHEGAVSAGSASAATRRSPSRRWSPATCASRATRAGRSTSATCTSRESVDEVRLRARARASTCRAEASPHHLLLTDEEVRTLDAARFKMSPPLAAEPRPAGARSRRLRDGTVDCIATDHAPHAPEEKEVPFEAAPNGVIGLETAFPALYTGLVEPGVARARDRRRRA